MEYKYYENTIPTVDDDFEIVEKSTKKSTKKSINESSAYDKCDEMYFAFIDVLGFKSSYYRDSNYPETCEEVFGYYFRVIDELMSKGICKRTYAGQTSDSLYFYTDNVYILSEYIKYFSHFYLFAMSKNMFFRGGIAKGDLKINESYQFYGNSVINAYLMECSIAKNPIVMIDNSTHNDLKQIDGFDDFKNKYIIEKEERYYINPFSCYSDDEMLDSSLCKFQGIVDPDKKKIYNNIVKGLENFEFDPNNYQKYIFLQGELDKVKKEE